MSTAQQSPPPPLGPTRCAILLEGGSAAAIGNVSLRVCPTESPDRGGAGSRRLSSRPREQAGASASRSPSAKPQVGTRESRAIPEPVERVSFDAPEEYLASHAPSRCGGAHGALVNHGSCWGRMDVLVPRRSDRRPTEFPHGPRHGISHPSSRLRALGRGRARGRRVLSRRPAREGYVNAILRLHSALALIARASTSTSMIVGENSRVDDLASTHEG